MTASVASKRNSGHWGGRSILGGFILLSGWIFLLGLAFIGVGRWWVGRSLEEIAHPSGDPLFLRTAPLLVALPLIQFLGAALLLLLLYRWIFRPLKSVAEAMHRFESGEYGVRAFEDAPGEVGAIQSGFNDLAARLEELVHELRRTDERRSELLATISHEIRTPLTSVRGYAQLISGGDAGPVTSEQKEFLGIIDRSALQLAEMVDSILDVERFDATGQWSSGKAESVPVSRLFAEVKSVAAVLAREKRLEWSDQVDEFAPGELRIHGDPGRLRRILLNLASNAVKYTRAGGVSLRAARVGDRIRIEVEDTGIGISKADQERLFQKYYRTTEARQGSVSGTGLGLYLVRKWVDSQGGAIEIDSVVGRGSVFRVWFPIQAAARIVPVGSDRGRE